MINLREQHGVSSGHGLLGLHCGVEAVVAMAANNAREAIVARSIAIVLNRTPRTTIRRDGDRQNRLRIAIEM